MAPLIDIVGKKREAIPVRLVGVDYTIETPKTYLAMMLAISAKKAEEDPEAMLDSLRKWLEKAFGKTGARDIFKRLEDEKDDLDLPDVSNLMTQVMKIGNENPPT